ncbi:unnamed protein product [Schistosoma guineensis]|nr:unnamed protein product [Schistosoma guineensis]
MYLCEKKTTHVVHIIIILVNMIYANGSLDANSRELLNLHETYRQDLVDCKVDGQPPAKYMSPLKWNYNLAAQAQKLANKCILQHDKRHSDEFSWVGQNIALHPTIKSGVDAWFNEHKLYDYNQNNCMKCLHYTQMVWAKTTDIGCGVASCPTYGLSIVCNYGPGGNWNNEKPYVLRSREFCPSSENTNNEMFVPSTISQLYEFTLSNVLNERTVSLDMGSNAGNHMNIQMINKTLPEPNIIMNDSICYYISH